MPSTAELIQSLYDRKRGLWERAKEVHARIEAETDGDSVAELQKEWEQHNSEISNLSTRINNLLTMQEQEKEMSAERERFSTLVTPDEEQHAGEFADRLRNFMRAGLGDVWAPKTFDLNLGTIGSGVEKEGIVPGRGFVERHDLLKGTSTAGAELVPTGFVRTLYEHLIAEASVRQTNAEVLRTTSGESLLVPKTTGHGAAAIVSEAGALAESDPAFAQVTVGAYKYGQLIQISRELIEDSAVDILGYLARAAGRAIGVANGAHLVTGTGTGQPQGVANAPTAGVTGATGTTTSVVGDSIIALYYSVLPGYRRNGYWIANDATWAAVRQLKDNTGGAGQGNYLWSPGLAATEPDTILNRPVLSDPTMAVMAANAYSIGFGDFSAFYVIRDVDGVRFERSDDFAFGNDLVSFRSIFRTDARQLINGANGAVKFYRNSAT